MSAGLNVAVERPLAASGDEASANRNFKSSAMELVGARGFEPPTPCSRSKCATRLRYAPPDRQPMNEAYPPGNQRMRSLTGSGAL